MKPRFFNSNSNEKNYWYFQEQEDRLQQDSPQCGHQEKVKAEKHSSNSRLPSAFTKMSGISEKQRETHGDGAGRQENGVKDGIDELINQERVVIFSKSTCPYCDDAKKVFDKLGQSYSTVELIDHPKGGEMQTVLKEMTGAGTVPRVFIDGKCIGGGSDTVQLYRNGRLEEILKKGSLESFDTKGGPDYTQRGSGEKFC